jgi:hypothetical protein
MNSVQHKPGWSLGFKSLVGGGKRKARENISSNFEGNKLNYQDLRKKRFQGLKWL